VKRPGTQGATSGSLVADTGGLLRAVAQGAKGESTWPDFARALVSARLVVVPDLVLAEVDYLLRRERAAMRALVADILDPETTYELAMTEPVDIVRALHIDARFASLELGLVDAIVCAIAERRGIRRVLTSDVRDFTAVRVGPRYERALTIVPELRAPTQHSFGHVNG
jgi:predicted nucleic acid-binding protein